MGSEQEEEFITQEKADALPAGTQYYGKCLQHNPTLCYGPTPNYSQAQQWVIDYIRFNPSPAQCP